MSDETVGEVVDKLQAFGTYTYIDRSAKAWHLKYVGSVQILPDGAWVSNYA